MRSDNRMFCRTCNIVFPRSGGDGEFDLNDHSTHDLTVVEMNVLLPEETK
jgi:hypothetical protein